MMKHSHRGRMISEIPRTSRSEKVGVVLIGRGEDRRSPELLPPIDISAGGPLIIPSRKESLSTPPLTSRLRDLESENVKLKLRLSEAELSLSNYKSLLNPNRNGTSKVAASTQTASNSYPGASAGGSDAEKRIEKLEKINVQLTRRIDELSCKAEEAMATSKRLLADNEILIKQLEIRREDSIQRNESSAFVDPSKMLRQHFISEVGKVHFKAESIRREFNDTRFYIDDLLAKFTDVMDQVGSVLLARLSSVVSAGPIPAQAPAQVVSVGSSPMHQPITSTISTSPIVWHGPMEDIIDDPLDFRSKSDQLCVDATTADLQKNETDISPTAEDATSNESTCDFNTGYSKKLVRKLKEFVEELEKAHRLESNAIKHTAHCKDLSRLASQRELTLERDRALIELKHARDVEDMLTFSLNTVEKLLSETQPNVVVRLTEMRAKKIRHIQNSLTAQSKELNQRSAEIGAMNSSHLDGFLIKAKSNQKSKEDDRTLMYDNLMAVLNEIESTDTH